MASAKAILVALYFMHLRFETKTLGYIALRHHAADPEGRGS